MLSCEFIKHSQQWWQVWLSSQHTHTQHECGKRALYLFFSFFFELHFSGWCKGWYISCITNKAHILEWLSDRLIDRLLLLPTATGIYFPHSGFDVVTLHVLEKTKIWYVSPHIRICKALQFASQSSVHAHTDTKITGSYDSGSWPDHFDHHQHVYRRGQELICDQWTSHSWTLGYLHSECLTMGYTYSRIV